MSKPVRPPYPHPDGAQPPAIPADLVPRHVALVMDGNGRWAKQRGLPRTEGHKMGEAALFDVIMGAIELGIPYLSAYAFSTENWRRSPDEVRFLMGFNRDVIRRRRDQLNEVGVRVRWAGRTPRLWRSVIKELQDAERMTEHNSVLTLQFCVNYGGRAEIADAAAAVAAEVAAGRLRPDKIDEKVLARYLDEPDIPDVDLFVRSSGEQRISNFLLWQSAYAELVFLDTLFPDFDRRHLWQACEIYARRDRRYGGAQPNLLPGVAGLAGPAAARRITAGWSAQALPERQPDQGRDGQYPQRAALGTEHGPGQRGQPGHERGDDQDERRTDPAADGEARDERRGHRDRWQPAGQMVQVGGGLEAGPLDGRPGPRGLLTHSHKLSHGCPGRGTWP